MNLSKNVSDYRGDCCKAIKDVRLRLKMAPNGKTLSFYCDHSQLARILRVIVYNDGKIIEQISKPDGILLKVVKI